MTAPTIAPSTAPNINHLQRGRTYHAITSQGSVTGEYLGIEAPYGDRAILLRHGAGTASVVLDHLTSIDLAA
jgi:hypothetical protein